MKFKIKLITPDNGGKFVMEMSNATLTTIAGHEAKDADLTITIHRSDLEDGTAKLADKVATGKATMQGNTQVLTHLASTMVQWDNWFEMVPGTKARITERQKIELFSDDDPLVIRPEN
jgi:alkyl sulfatase BDS1-like metallo-beta-lactamase superfamily hydrolase